VATGGDGHAGEVRLWDRSGKLRAVLLGHAWDVRALAWSPDGRLLASGSVDGSVRIWEATSGKCVAKYQGTDNVQSLAFSPDGHLLAVGFWAARLLVLEPATGVQRGTREGVNVNQLCWSPDGALLATVGGEGKVVLWNAESLRPVGELPVPDRKADDPKGLRTVAWSPDGKRLAVLSTTEPVVRVYDADRGGLVCTLKGHETAVDDVLWCADGQRLITCGRDDTVRLWDGGSGASLQVFRNPPERLNIWSGARRLAWWREDRLLLVLAQHQVLQLDVVSGRWAASPYRTTDQPVQLAAGRGGAAVAIGANFCWVTVNLPGEHRFRIVGQMPGALRQLAWLADGDRLLAGASASAQGYAVAADRKLGTLIPDIEGGHWLTVGSDGHYRGSEGIERHLVYVALHDDGSLRTYTPAEFTARFGWKNDPERATFLKP